MGEVGGARLTTSSGGTPAERRQEILETTLQAVKRCQVWIIVTENHVFYPKHFSGEIWGKAGTGHRRQ